MQMAERGLPVFPILQEKLKLTAKEMENIGNAGIKSTTAINALLTGLNERFAGAMEKQSKTLMGTFSNLSDNVYTLLGISGQKFNEKIKGFLQAINIWFDKNKQDIMQTMETLFNTIGSIFDTLVNVLGVF